MEGVEVEFLILQSSRHCTALAKLNRSLSGSERTSRRAGERQVPGEIRRSTSL